MTSYKLIPYGISNFEQVRRENLYYADKTEYIPKMENAGNFLFLIRPRRFGKSLFLSMLRYYYDIQEKDNFGNLFSGLWIEKNQTPLAGGFQVLYLDFSRVGGDIETLSQSFDVYCSAVAEDFARRYEAFYPPEYLSEVLRQKTFVGKLNVIDLYAKRMKRKLYLIVDEYDNFTNVVLNVKGEQVYHAMTHAEGFYRGVFKQYKGMFDRILMMGVSPVTMDDVTSGYNIATSLTLDPDFNMMLGFSETEVREMIRYYQGVGALKADEDALIAEMKPWYDGYCFSRRAIKTDPKMYNTDMVSYYLRNYINHGEAPEEMLDRNTATDYNKLDKLIRLDKLDGDRKSVILEVAQNGFTLGEVQPSFPTHRLIEPDMFKSLLYYYGLLTIGGTDGMDTILSIPNNNVRKQFYEYLVIEYSKIKNINVSELSRHFKAAALNGDWRPMMEYICRQYHDTTTVRSLIEGERNIQGFMTAYFSLNPYYLTNPEVELSHGYCDFFMMPDFHRCTTTAHAYIVELKYLKPDATEEAAAKQWDEAVEQIKGYGAGKTVLALAGNAELHLIAVQIKGYSLYRMEEIIL